MSDPFACLLEAEGEYRAAVMASTWGHLEAKPGTTHELRMLFTCTAYGDLVLIDSEHPTMDDAPGLYILMNEHVENVAKRGKVYRFDGHLVVDDEGNRKLVGSSRCIDHWKLTAK